MARKLPVTAPNPSLDAVRKRLGGRAATDPGAGDVVRLDLGPEGERVGVVLFAQGEALDVWLATGMPTGLVRRTTRGRAARHDGPTPDDLASVADDARVFGALREGERVRYEPSPGRYGEGTLGEKCRFGGVLVRDDGVLVGVGFRRLWPACEGPSPGAN
jgi:hypothetical protein